jgi:hypothetical protein
MEKNNKEISDIKSSEVKPDSERDERCAPHLKSDKISCIQLDVLIEMAEAYNKTKNNDNEKIKLYPNMETMNPKLYKKYLIRNFNNKIKRCDNQRCWVNQDFINNMENKAREKLQKYTFRPNGPDGRFEWLNTININEVMDQYQHKYKNFKFMGAIPIDFDDLPALGIKNINFKNLIDEGKHKLGFVFNLDEHYKSGSHWVALYTDLKKNQIYYYDSYGIEPEKRIRTLMRRIGDFCKNYNGSKINDLDARHNKIRHQFENSECGVYSINFILRLLDGDTFEQITEDKTHDKKINLCRNIYFNNTKIKGGTFEKCK